MAVTALVLWVITALGGFYLLASWLSRGGMAQQRSGTSAFRVPLIFGHFGLATAGLVLWIIYLVVDSDSLTWVGFAILVVVALLGFTMFARWLSGRRAAVPAGTSAQAAEVPAERQLPVPVVLLHGLLAATTLVLVLLTALGMGG